MIDWDRADELRFVKPDGFDDPAHDDIFGDESELEASCARGEEQIMYLMRQTDQRNNLIKMNGPTDTSTREPEFLADLEPEPPNAES